MSKKTFCDIKDCTDEGSSYRVDYLHVDTVPTGNSDYSAYEEKTVKRKEFDLCKKHATEYDKRIANVLVKSEKGLYFPNE